jgi:L-gulono-1,4-lactone dehydrogenase
MVSAATTAWRNWGRTASCTPVRTATPAGDDEIAQVLKEAAAAGLTAKVTGTGHSFTDIACTDGVQIKLDRHARLLDVDTKARTATVEAGIPLMTLADELAQYGLALSNLGDIGYQTVAGATSTATHGTGAKFGTLSTQIVKLRLVTADGSALDLTRESDPDAFRAAQVGLGALGVLSRVTIQCEPAFNLHAVEQPEKLDAVLESFEDRVRDNEHFEFYWFPHTDICMTKENNRTEAPLKPKSRSKTWFDDMFIANRVFGVSQRVGRRWPSSVPRIAKLAGVLLGKTEEVDRSDRVFLTPRLVRFSEMEYSIPREAAPQGVRAVKDIIERDRLIVSFPIEVRAVAPDDALISPAYGSDRAYIAVHMFQGVDFHPYFRAVEAAMRDLGGRPHWGKWHYRTAEDLRPAYPEFDRFLAVRDRLDPNRLFQNAYLERVLGP